MKPIVMLLAAMWLSGCAYTYDMGVKDGSSEAATLTFSNRIKMAEIDEQLFEPKYSIWVDGSHTVHLPAGLHKFRFRYDAVGGYGGYYTRDFISLSRYLEPGQTYELQYKSQGSRIYFEILNTSLSQQPSEPVPGKSEGCTDADASACSQDAKVSH
jgi:hypothetical protein